MKALKIIGIVLAIIVLLGAAGYLYLQYSTQSKLKSLVCESVDMNAVADGSYIGEAEVWPVLVRVEVSVSNHKIVSIDILEHRTGLGKKAEAITSAMTEKNTYDIDAVSGATISSEAIKSAVNRALTNGSR